MTTVTIGSVVLAPFLDESTAWMGFYFSKLEDWYSLPQSKARQEERPNAHGAFGGGFDWRQAAVPSIEGGFVGADEATALAAMDTLKRAWATGEQLLMTVADANVTTSRTVSVRFLTIPDHHGLNRFTFALDTLARDPLRYGGAVAAGPVELPSLSGGLAFPIVFPIDFAVTGTDGRLVTANPGTQDTFSRFVVTGGMAGGFSLVSVEDGREIRLEFPIATTDVVTVDPRTARVTINSDSNIITGFLTRSEWWPVPAGGSRTVQFSSIGPVTGTPTLTAFTAPAYL